MASTTDARRRPWRAQLVTALITIAAAFAVMIAAAGPAAAQTGDDTSTELPDIPVQPSNTLCGRPTWRHDPSFGSSTTA